MTVLTISRSALFAGFRGGSPLYIAVFIKTGGRFPIALLSSSFFWKLRTFTSEKDDSYPPAFGLLLRLMSRLLSKHSDDADQGRSSEKIQAFGVPMGTVVSFI